MYGFEDVTAWFPAAIKPVRHGAYEVVTYEGGPVRQAQWRADGWYGVDVECWRGLMASSAAAVFESLLSEKEDAIRDMSRSLALCNHERKDAIDTAAWNRKEADDALRRIQQLQDGALKAIELIGRLHGSVTDTMLSVQLDKALDAIKRALFPPLE